MIGPDDSLTGGLLGACALIVANGVLARLNVRSRRIARLLNGRPTPLIENGRILHRNLRHELMTDADLEHADEGILERDRVRVWGHPDRIERLIRRLCSCKSGCGNGDRDSREDEDLSSHGSALLSCGA